MPPIRLNRRRFLGLLGRRRAGAGPGPGRERPPSRPRFGSGLIGVGNRGTSAEDRAGTARGRGGRRLRLRGPAPAPRPGDRREGAGRRPVALERVDPALDRTQVDAVLVALPCDLHAGVYATALRAGKHLYAEKPLA